MKTFAEAQAVLAERLPGYESRPTPMLDSTGLSVDEFWSRFEVKGECWEWAGSRYPNNYGRVWSTPQKRHLRTHRVSFEIAFGTPRLHVLHRCDNPPCGRPDHLFEGTDKDNSLDALSKGRLVLPAPMRGESNPRAKFSDDLVSEVRDRYRMGETQSALAKELGVHQTTISLWVNGKGRVR